MKIAVIVFSKYGMILGTRLKKLSGHQMNYYVARRHVSEIDAISETTGVNFESFDSVYDLTSKLFNQMDALVFICATGIAVRAIAPLIKSKLTDPAVIVCDETGQFAISLLSGHVGGANQLTKEIAQVIDAVPVITTASDSHAAIEDIPQTKNLILGIGCRRGVSAETIERVATILLWNEKIPFNRVVEMATIDVKKDEEGLLQFAKIFELPLHFYSAEELKKVKGDFFASEWVSKTVGVDNVCERAAVLCGGKGKLIMKKTARDGVTVAVYERE